MPGFKNKYISLSSLEKITLVQIKQSLGPNYLENKLKILSILVTHEHMVSTDNICPNNSEQWPHARPPPMLGETVHTAQISYHNQIHI